MRIYSNCKFIYSFVSPLLDKLSIQMCSWQGSAHTGPALTPVEVLVAIHGIVPEKDGLALKKACILSFYITKLIMNSLSLALHLGAKVNICVLKMCYYAFAGLLIRLLSAPKKKGKKTMLGRLYSGCKHDPCY